MVKRCFVPNCKTGRKSVPNNEYRFSIFKAPNDENLLEKWRMAIPLRERELNSQDRVCERHFETRYVIPRWQQSRYGDYYEDHIRPKLTPDAVPTLFPDLGPNGTIAFKEKNELNLLPHKISLELPEVEVNESDYVPVCYKCLIKKCSSHIEFFKE